MDGVNAETIVVSFWKKRGVVLNASTGQTYVNYFIKGLPKYMDDMIDYIVSISTNLLLIKTVLKKKKKQVIMNYLYTVKIVNYPFTIY